MYNNDVPRVQLGTIGSLVASKMICNTVTFPGQMSLREWHTAPEIGASIWQNTHIFRMLQKPLLKPRYLWTFFLHLSTSHGNSWDRKEAKGKGKFNLIFIILFLLLWEAFLFSSFLEIRSLPVYGRVPRANTSQGSMETHISVSSEIKML